MRNVGYMTYDKDNLYIACDVTDVAPKAAANSKEYWHSTNLQILMFVNDERCFPTIAYEGTNKVKVWGDDRSVLDYEAVKCTFTEKSATNFIYEVVIPWNAVPGVDNVNDVKTFTIGIVQSSMANGYVCSAFGEAYDLDASKTIPVTMVAENTANNTTSSEAAPTSSATTNTDASDVPTTGTEIVTDSSNTTASEVTDNENDNETTTTIIQEQADKDWTPIIIIAVIAVVIIAGGAVAIILMNKKPKAE